jgi:hypothetical protein
MTFHEFLADLLMLAHAFYSLFILLGCVLIIAGMILGWRWTRFPWFRILHLTTTLFVVARVWLAIPCPFSAAENALRPPGASCLLSDSFHTAFHRLAFRGHDPHRFAISSTMLGAVVAASFILSSSAPQSRADLAPRTTNQTTAAGHRRLLPNLFHATALSVCAPTRWKPRPRRAWRKTDESSPTRAKT